MGIPGLLPLVASAMEAAHISKYAGEKVAVDAYAWLHKGSYSCAPELCLGLQAVGHVK